MSLMFGQLAAATSVPKMSMMWGLVDPMDIVAWILEDGLPVRFQLQLHKLVWPPDAQGVLTSGG